MGGRLRKYGDRARAWRLRPRMDHLASCGDPGELLVCSYVSVTQSRASQAPLTLYQRLHPRGSVPNPVVNRPHTIACRKEVHFAHE